MNFDTIYAPIALAKTYRSLSPNSLLSFQALLIASVLVFVAQHKALFNRDNAILYEAAIDYVESIESRFGYLGRKVSQLKASWSIVRGIPGVQESTRMLIALNLVSFGLQIATVVGSVYGASN